VLYKTLLNYDTVSWSPATASSFNSRLPACYFLPDFFKKLLPKKKKENPRKPDSENTARTPVHLKSF